MIIKKIDSISVPKMIMDVLTSKDEIIYYTEVKDKNYLLIGTNDDYNEEAVKKYNLEIAHLEHSGGMIVANKGDLGVAIFSKDIENGKKLQDEFLSRIIKLLEKTRFNVEYTGNDILLNNRKVIGCGSRNINGLFYFTTFINMNSDLEIIKEVCTKEMIKVPDGLTHYGIKKEDIFDIIEEVARMDE